MKKAKTLLILSLSFITLSACGGGNTDTSSASQSGAPQTSQRSSQQTSQEASKSEASQEIVVSETSAPIDWGDKTVALYNKDSRLIGTPRPDPLNPMQVLPMAEANIQIGKLPTYRHKDKGDVPYVSLSDLAKALGEALPTILKPGMAGEKKDDGYHLYSSDKRGEIILDAEKNTIKVKNGQSFGTPILAVNNDLPGDYCAYRGKSIQESDKTRAYKDDGTEAPEFDVFDFGKYNFDIVMDGNECYVPLEAFTKVLFRDISVDMAYNGVDFYTNVSESSFLASWAYSSKGMFMGISGLYGPSKTKGEGEAYRFEFGTKRLVDGSTDVFEDYTRYLVLKDDGKAYSMICKGTTLDPTKAVQDIESDYGYSWKKEGNILHIDVSDQQGPLGTYYVHLDETRFLSGKMSKEVSAYNYDVLRFIFDTIYGLKAIKGYTDATAFFKSAGVDEGLKSEKPSTYTEAFSKLIGYIDDGHTGFNNMTPFSAYDDLDKKVDYDKFASSGERLKKLREDAKKYMKAKFDMTKKLDPDGMNPDDVTYYQGIKFSSDKSTAIISFNAFQHNGEDIQNMGEMFPGEFAVDEANYNIVTRAKFINSSPDGFTTVFKVLDTINAKDKVVKNVVIDLSTNGGGEIATMPYISAFFSDDPVFAVKDTYSGVTREYHYKVDLNGDGTYGGEGDTYKGKYDFYVLTSPFSFSCGNCLPGLAKDAGVKVIGERSGGGTSPVGVYFDALGSFFNLSNHYDMSYKVEGKYVQNDAGTPLDHEFPMKDGNWYDPNAVDAFLKTL